MNIGFVTRANWLWPCIHVLLFVIPIGVGLVACGDIGVHVRVKPFSTGNYPPPKPQGAVIDEWPSEPSRPHVKLAKLIATSQSDDEDILRAKIVEKARSIGADGVVMGKFDMLEHMGHPRFQSTLTSEIRNSVFSGGPGIGIPMFFDPWTYHQTSGDGITWTMYLSGVAIRYLDIQQ